MQGPNSSQARAAVRAGLLSGLLETESRLHNKSQVLCGLGRNEGAVQICDGV